MLRVQVLAMQLGDFAIHDLSFSVEPGDYFVLLGVSGAGKSVLLESIAGLMTPDSGTVLLDGEDITGRRIQRRGFGLVFQDQALFPHMNVARNIAYGMPKAQRTNERIHALAEAVGVTELLNRYPISLSGGEAQRVALARALATKPRCLLLDEPISALDVNARSELRTLLRRLNREGHTIIHVTHDYEEAISLASRVGIMENGTVVQVGTPRDVFHHPRSEFVADFVGIPNFFRGELKLQTNACGVGSFRVDELTFSVLTDAQPGKGCLLFRSEDVVVSLTPSDTSARNKFQGTVREVVPARRGLEIIIDIGVEVVALVTERSVTQMGLEPGKEVWISVKASAERFIAA